MSSPIIPNLQNVQKFADTPISSAAMGDLSRVKTADEMTLDFPWDVTSPEGIIAFFGAKMQSKDADLKSLMYSQEARNAASRGMKSMKDLLSNMGDQRIEPGTPQYDEFKRLAAEIEPTLGASVDDQSLKATIDTALAPGHYEKQFDVYSDAAAMKDFLAAHPDATFVSSNNDGGIVRTKTYAIENAPQAIDPATVKDLSNKLTTISDSYTSANQLDMIKVQDLVNQISQITSLASNIVHSFNEAAMGPIGNIK